MNAERRRKRRIKNGICIAYCALQLLAVLLLFQGLGKVIGYLTEDTKEVLADIVFEPEEPKEEDSRLLVCLDAGHGGTDNGSDYKKRMEKDDTLRIAQAVAAYLKSRDVDVVMTREEDTKVRLAERCDFANEKKADYFVSLHRNDGDGKGVEIWIHNNPTDETATLAENIMQGLEAAGIQKNRGVKKGTQKGENGNYYVNLHSDMPSCIVELGFINNEEDNRLFDGNLEAYAAAIGDAVLKTYEGFRAQEDTGGTPDGINPSGTPDGINPGGTPDGTDQDGTNSAGKSDENAAENTAAQYPQIEDVESLDNKSLDWGQGTIADEKNRPVGAVAAQEKYGGYNALFLAGESNTIYLTIDEGYEYGYTESMLDTLKEKNVPAVFFVTEPYAKGEPELVKRMIAEGHAVGNHSVTHPASGLPSLSIEAQQQEVMGNHQYIKENFDYDMHLFRYPAGKFSVQSLAVVNNCGYKSVFWSFAYVDYDVNNQPGQAESLRKMTDRLHPGAVYLLHGESETNAAVLGTFIDEVRKAGYEFALVS